MLEGHSVSMVAAVLQRPFATRAAVVFALARVTRKRVCCCCAVFALTALVSSALAGPPSPNWYQVNQNGFVTGQTATSAGSPLFVFDGKLYAFNEFGLFRMDDPVARTWTQVALPAQPGGPGTAPQRFTPLGNYLYAYDSDKLWWIAPGMDLTGPNWHAVTSTGLPGGASPTPYVVFSSKIYGAYLTTSSGPFEIWRTGDIGADSATWERVVQNSFGDPTNNKRVDVMTVFNGKVYAGTETLGSGSFGDPAIYGTGVEVWESASGDSGAWSQVNTDGFGTMYPTPPCYSPTLCTFPIHQVIGSAGVYQAPSQSQAYLYIGTLSHFGAEVWRYNGNGNPATGWANVTQSWMGPCQIGCGPGRDEAMAVFQGNLWLAEGYPTANLAYYDGSNWSVVVSGPNPFDTHNGGLMSLAVFQNRLYVSTLHAFGDYSQGDQVWRYTYSPATVTGTKTASGGPFHVGSTVTYTVGLSNASTFAQLDNPGDEFTDTLPAQLTLVGATATSGTVTRAGNTVHWNGTIPAGGSVTITSAATVNAGTAGMAVSNQGTINYDADGDGTNDATHLTNASSFFVSSPSDVTGVKTVLGNPNNFRPTFPIQYRVVLTNNSDYDQMDGTGDEFIDALPPQLTLTGATATGGVVTTAANTVRWNGVIPAHTSVTITISATIAPTTPYGATITNVGTIHYDPIGDGSNSGTRQVSASFEVAIPIPAVTSMGLALLALGVLAGGALLLYRFQASASL